MCDPCPHLKFSIFFFTPSSSSSGLPSVVSALAKQPINQFFVHTNLKVVQFNLV